MRNSTLVVKSYLRIIVEHREHPRFTIKDENCTQMIYPTENRKIMKMQLRVDIIGIESGGKPIVFLNKHDADEVGVTALGRIIVNSKRKETTAIVNISTTYVKKGSIGVNDEVRKKLDLRQNSWKSEPKCYTILDGNMQ